MEDFFNTIIKSTDSYVNKAKEGLSGYAKDASEYTNDKIADVILTAESRKIAINKALRAKGSQCRVGSILIGSGIPPKVSFAITSSSQEKEETELLVKSIE